MSRVARGWVALLAVPLALSACTAGSEADREAPEQSAPVDAVVAVAVDDSPSTYNTGSRVAGPDDAAALNQVLRTFSVVGADGTLVSDTEFGTAEKVSDDPLVVQYTIDPDAEWSDGEPVDCDDVLLDWAAHSGAYADVAAFEADGSPGYALVAKPECDDGDREFTYTYRDTFADWQSMPGRMMPAHVAELRSGVADVVDAVTRDDVAEIADLASFWASGWDRQGSAGDLTLVPSSGPYAISQWDEGGLRLEANPLWWGTPPGVARLDLLVVPPGDRAEALLAGTVQVAQLPPDPATVERVDGAGDDVLVDVGPSFSLAQLRFVAGGVLDGALGEAFARCVPRRQVVAEQVGPLLVDAEPAASRFAFPFQPQYEDVASSVDDGGFGSADPERTRAALEASGDLGLRVRLAYDEDDARLAGAARAIVRACTDAGFDVVDVGGAATSDVLLTVDEGGPLLTDGVEAYRTGGRHNSSGFSSPAVDAALAELVVTPDPMEQIELVKQLDTLLWQGLASVPLYTVPEVAAHHRSVEGVSLQPADAGITWNAVSWTLVTPTP